MMADRPRPQRELPKRFYERIAVEPAADGFAVVLDGRPIRTPARAQLVVPREPVAEAIAAEWRGQGERIDPARMPATRLANSALDGVAARTGAVIDEVVSFAGSDLLFYRAEAPEQLVTRQAALWDPILAEAEQALAVRFVLAEGVMPVEQSAPALAVVRRAVPVEPFALAGVNLLTTLTGSALIALAVRRGALPLDAAWAAAHVDEDWNISLWGEDAEAAARRARRYRDAEAAAIFAAG
jgi:chaperone required for assembly of F1-ATPase